MPRAVAVILLLLCTSIWGLAFVAQKWAMASMGPLTFTGSRFLLGGLVALPFAIGEYRRVTATGFRLTREQWLLTGALSLVFFIGSVLQQFGLTMTTVTNGGFLTALYVLFTPVIAYLAVRRRPHPIIYIGAPMALIGIFYLNGGSLDRLGIGDLLVIICAVFWGMHVFLLGLLARETAMPIFLSCATFLVAGLLSAVFALPIEGPTIDQVFAAWPLVAYTGVMSTALAFTLQALAQQYLPEANTAVILSSESLFAALGGALLLGERLVPMGYAGAALIFCAILMVEVVPAIGRRRERAAA